LLTGNSIGPVPEAPWNRPRKGKDINVDKKQILQDIRTSLHEAIAGNKRGKHDRDLTRPHSSVVRATMCGNEPSWLNILYMFILFPRLLF